MDTENPESMTELRLSDWVCAIESSGPVEWRGGYYDDCGRLTAWLPDGRAVVMIVDAQDGVPSCATVTTDPASDTGTDYHTPADLSAALSPRRTLADVVANPPSGWTVTVSPGGGISGTLYRWERGREVSVLWEPTASEPIEVDIYGHETVASAAAAVRAVAKLLGVLAEVSDV